MKRVAIVASLCWLAAARHAAASPSGSLAGHVTDEAGHPIGDVRITVTGRGAVGVHRAATDHDGLYQLVGLPTLERLDVTASVVGKAPVTYSGLEVRQDSVTRRDFRLRPFGVKEMLVVYDRRVPYHKLAVEGFLDSIGEPVTQLELSGKTRKDARLLREAATRRFNAVVAFGSTAARLARREVHDSPVVYAMVLDPVVEDLGTTNLCGSPINGAFDDQIKVLRLLKSGARTLATIYDPRRLAGAVGDLRRAASAQGMALLARPARDAGQLIKALESLRREPLDAFLFLLDPELFDAGGFERVRQFAENRGIVLVVPDPSFVAVGGTFSYSPGFHEMGAYSARLVKHIFSGAAEPSDLATRYPTVRYFSVNPFEVERLGLKIPEEWTHGSGHPASRSRR